MARVLRAWALNRGGKNSVRNLRYGPRTRLVRGMDLSDLSFLSALDLNVLTYENIHTSVVDVFFCYRSRWPN